MEKVRFASLLPTTTGLPLRRLPLFKLSATRRHRPPTGFGRSGRARRSVGGTGASPPGGNGPGPVATSGDLPPDDGQMFLWIAAVLAVLAGLLGLVWFGGRLQRKNTEALLRRAKTLPNLAAQRGINLPEPSRSPDSPGSQVVDTPMLQEALETPTAAAAEPTKPPADIVQESDIITQEADSTDGSKQQQAYSAGVSISSASNQSRPAAQQNADQKPAKAGSLKSQMQNQAAGVAQAVQSIFKPLRTNSETAPEPELAPDAPQPDAVKDSLHELQEQHASSR